jgi:hypothetical protein
MSVPARLMYPACWGRSPAMVSSRIVFPAPDGPSTTRTRSVGMFRLTGPRVKDPAWPVSSLTLSPRSAVGTVNAGEQPPGGQGAQDQEGGQRDDQQHDGGRR